jgi:hypothetical protein
MPLHFPFRVRIVSDPRHGARVVSLEAARDASRHCFYCGGSVSFVIEERHGACLTHHARLQVVCRRIYNRERRRLDVRNSTEAELTHICLTEPSRAGLHEPYALKIVVRGAAPEARDGHKRRRKYVSGVSPKKGRAALRNPSGGGRPISPSHRN